MLQGEAEMMPMTLVNDAWLGVVGYWVISARSPKAVRLKDPLRMRILSSLLLIIGLGLLFSPRLRRGFLHNQFLPTSSGLITFGVLLTFAGAGFAIWARYHLGSNWSGQVVIRENHELIQSGPYRWIRHPIYSGLLLAALGTVIAVGQVGAILGAVLMGISFAWKAKQEEQRLLAVFGEAFTAHRTRTGMFLPRFR